MPEDLGLAQLQRWMRAVIVDPDSAEAGVASASAREVLPPERLEDLVMPSPTLTAVERVGIYQGMYLLRMRDALASDYPAVQRWLGDHGFWELVRDYVQAFPSRSYTLNRLGDHLPAFIAGKDGLRRRAFVHDLARLELAVTEAFDSQRSPVLSAEAIAAVPPDSWAAARFRPVASFRQLDLRYPAGPWLDWTREGGAEPVVRRGDYPVVVFRRELAVHRLDLSRDAGELLAMLASNTALGDAVGTVMKRRRGLDEARLFRWFRDWVGGGLFQDVRWD